MSMKRKISLLTTALVMFTVISVFCISLYLNWNRVLNDKYLEVSSISNLLDESLDGTYDDLLSNPNMTDTQKVSALNKELQPFVTNITNAYPNFGAGYYVKELNSIVAFGPNFKEQGLIDISQTSEVRTVYDSGEPLEFYNYSPTRGGFVVANIRPIIRDGEIIGHTWGNVLMEDVFTLFKDDFIQMIFILFIMIIIGLIGSHIITNQYFKSLKLFKEYIVQNQNQIDFKKFSPELVEVYKSVENNRCALIESEKRFRDVVTAFDEFVWEVDLEGRYTYLSGRVSSILGYLPEELLGTFIFNQITDEDKERIKMKFSTCIKEQVPFRDIIYKKINKSGEVIHLNSTSLPMYNNNGELIGFRGATRDISIQVKHEQHIHQLAYFDNLTKLPNRASLIRDMEDLIQQSNPFAVLFVDLDHFKSINDTLGHRVGDELLTLLSKRIQDFLHQSDKIYRFGGDEFIIIMQHFKEVEEILSRTECILEAVQQPFILENMPFFTTLSIGISLYPTHAQSKDALIKYADMAMYKSKENGKNQFTLYIDNINNEVTETFEISRLLNEAINEFQFELYYQPQVCINSEQVVGVEALVRWIHPTKGFISPAKFIPIAEESGQIIKLGDYILRNACTTRRKWLDEGVEQIRVAVNISLKQFQQEDFIDKVLMILEETGLEGRYLELEITESIAMNNTEAVIQKLQVLQNHQIYISIDDFGMGYSSLNYLKRLPIQQLKIDRAFVQDIEDNKDYAIVKSIVTMAQSLGLDVVAEGVETYNQANVLNQLNCTIAQGYLYYRPMPEHEVKNVLLTKRES